MTYVERFPSSKTSSLSHVRNTHQAQPSRDLNHDEDCMPRCPCRLCRCLCSRSSGKCPYYVAVL